MPTFVHAFQPDYDDIDVILAGMVPDDPEDLLLAEQEHLDRLDDYSPACPPAAPGVPPTPPGAGSSTPTGG